MPSAEDGEAGTTLVELLVALALFALIALFAFGGLEALQARGPLSRRMTALEEVAAVRDHLRRTIGETVARLPLSRDLRFAGAPDGVEFLAAADPLLETGGLMRVRLALRPGAEGGLDLVEWRALDRGREAGPPSETVLLSNVSALSFRYGGAATGLLPAWSDPARLPAAVTLDLSFSPGDPRRWTTLAVALASGGGP